VHRLVCIDHTARFACCPSIQIMATGSNPPEARTVLIRRRVSSYRPTVPASARRAVGADLSAKTIRRGPSAAHRSRSWWQGSNPNPPEARTGLIRRQNYASRSAPTYQQHCAYCPSLCPQGCHRETHHGFRAKLKPAGCVSFRPILIHTTNTSPLLSFQQDKPFKPRLD
jgi:hypothetical protein